MKDVDFDSTIRYDASFFENLNRIVQAEPWIPRDRAMIGMLKSIGIEKGKPFRPSAETNKVLASAVREAGEELEARYDAGLPGFFTEKSRWTYAVPLEYVKAMSSGFGDPDDYPIHARGMLYTYAFVGIRHLGGGQFYLMSLRDKDGNNFHGGKSYRLTVPPNVPVEEYWSATAYDRKTHALIKGMPRASCASNDSKVQKNADGSVDVYFGPKPPAGKESNWVPTDPSREFEVMARFYAPKKEFFDKVWKLPDVEEVK